MNVVAIDRVIDPARRPFGWMGTHAAYPTPVRIDDRVRLFFSSRDEDNRGRVGWCDVDVRNPATIISGSRHSMFDVGRPGTFDDCGISVSQVLKIQDHWRMYYLGWNRPTTVPLHNAIGLAVSKAPDRFHRAFEGPLLDRSLVDPFSVSYPFVMRKGNKWTMYYGTHRGSGLSEKTMAHVITSAYSKDGIRWAPSGETVIGLKRGEFALARPWLIPANSPLMMFTIYGKHRRIGLARQERNGRWRRINDDFIPRSREPWASDDVCYASHLRTGGRDLIFYCGNGYGRTGFGVAEVKA